jgi:hypothetical protein
MTAAQIESIIGSSNMNILTHVPEIMYIAFKKDANVLRADINTIRFKFDKVNNILEVVYVRPFSQKGTLPEHEKYSTLDLDGVSTIFEHLTKANGETIVDYYSFDSITTIGLV